MNGRFFTKFFMSLSFIHSYTYSLSPQNAAIATGLTTIGIVTGSYYIFKKHYKMHTMENIGLTAAISAPLGYIASMLWFGLTPEMRYMFAHDVAQHNDIFLCASDKYESVQHLLERVEADYRSYNWLVELHDDMVKMLSKTRSALKNWTLAQDEEATIINPSWQTYERLQKQRATLEHNLLLLRRYRPFQEQHNAWMSAHNCHYAYRY